jgi:5-bromo-4-chloroindolyl phosphate hydrolysis protein
MRIDPEQALAKAEELFPDACHQAKAVKREFIKDNELTKYELAEIRYNLLKGVLTIASLGGLLEHMRVIVTLRNSDQYNMRVSSTERSWSWPWRRRVAAS